MNVTSTTRARIETGGDGDVAHVGLHALGRFADALGLGAALSARIMPTAERFPLHDRGEGLGARDADARGWRRCVFGCRGVCPTLVDLWG